VGLSAFKTGVEWHVLTKNLKVYPKYSLIL
jgi:hypothetical protein